MEKSVSLYTRVQRVKVLDVFSKNPRIFLKLIFGLDGDAQALGLKLIFVKLG
jgi:hypothetical protein